MSDATATNEQTRESAWQRYFHGQYSAARAYLFSKLFLCTVALDTWMLMIGHAGRYGVDGFNVAQFRWLDRVQPLPTAALYVGVLVLAGLLALSIAVCGNHPLALAALFVLYTFSWSMSMLDSYQHHYFVSSVLFCLVFFPRVTATQIHPLHALPAALEKPAKTKRKAQHAEQNAARAESRGWLYVLACGVAIFAYAVIDTQHSWLLFEACIGVIALATWRYAGTSGAAPATTSGFGYNLLGATVGVLYTYTSIAKMDAQWCAGHTILRISSAERVFAPLVGWFVQLGMPAERFWSLFATSVIPLELSVALGYWLAVRQDASDKPWVRWACAIAWFMAMTLHVGAEAMGLQIGWFSYYMMLLAAAYLLPAGVVDRLCTLLSWPARFAAVQLADWESDDSTQENLPALGLAAAVAVVLGLVGKQIDLPGAQAACLCAGAALCALVLWAATRKRAARLRRVILGTGIAALLMWGAIARSEVRWDFYRYLGGDLKRRNQPEAALEAYLKGERYAPPGQSRKDKIAELKQELGR